MVHATGGFVKEDPATGGWMTAGTFLAREKVSQTFRDILSDGYKSSKASKKKRRQELMAVSCTSTEEDLVIEPTGKRQRQSSDDNEDSPPPTLGNSAATSTADNNKSRSAAPFSDAHVVTPSSCDVVSPYLAPAVLDTSSLEPTPMWEDDYDIDTIFESPDVIPVGETKEVKKEDRKLCFPSKMGVEFLNEELATKLFNQGEELDLFMEENVTSKSINLPGGSSSNHAAEFLGFLPTRHTASARTA